MEYRYFGKSGLKVSVLGFGNMANDDKSKEENIEIIKSAFDLGINYFDTAEFYNDGKAEECLGISLKKYNIPRDEIVISTKIYSGRGFNNFTPNVAQSLSRKHITEGVDASLKRLQLEYVDIVYASP